MYNKRPLFQVALACSLFLSCTGQRNSISTPVQSLKSDVLVACNKTLTDAIVSRHFTPPVAARNYSYPNIGVYLALQPVDHVGSSFIDDLRDLNWKKLQPSMKYMNWELVAMHTFYTIAYPLIYKDAAIKDPHEKSLKRFEVALSSKAYKMSIAYAEEVASKVLAWAEQDNYLKTRGLPIHPRKAGEGEWSPTAPDFMDAIEPNWNQIRPFFLDSANQFIIERPTQFDITENSPFFLELKEVKAAVDSTDDLKTEIAQFWDCNPNISHHHGHFMYFKQKISPGGHWVHIALQAIQQNRDPLILAANRMALLTATLHDAFIACWDEKYRSNYIRPETVIKELYDIRWEPILQTPPFPEYPSGHSVASAAAATVLTEFYGDSFKFTDSTERKFGLPDREFNSFREASNEAAISRLYGGIHFMPAIDNGILMGNSVGRVALKTRE